MDFIPIWSAVGALTAGVNDELPWGPETSNGPCYASSPVSYTVSIVPFEVPNKFFLAGF
jgi:hypothetical protein